MNDMRQKLLPVFLEEAGRKLLQLDDFLSATGGGEKSLEELETAFRAVHTLKGTAALVQAEAVRSLSARMEGLLGGHFERGQFPSEVEYEAMQSALESLGQLIKAVEKKQPEPAGVLAEAELVLKLATANPGNGRLADLFGAEDHDDPFADDPDLDDLTQTAEFSPAGDRLVDPFADDPEIEQVFVGETDYTVVADSGEIDPFADDPELELALPQETTPAPETAATDFSEISDPFADDPELECQSPEYFADIDFSDPVLLSSPVPPSYPEPDSTEINTETKVLEPAQPSRFIERMRQRIEKESPLQTAERLARTLLSQHEGEAVVRQYASCNFTVATKDFYLPIEDVVEITDLPMIVSLPLAPAVVLGLINLRGQVLPVIDLGIQTGTASNYQALRKLIIAESDGEKLAFLSEGIPDLSETVLGEKVDVRNFIDQFRAGAP